MEVGVGVVKLFEPFHANLHAALSWLNPKWLITELCVAIYVKGESLQVSFSRPFMRPLP